MIHNLQANAMNSKLNPWRTCTARVTVVAVSVCVCVCVCPLSHISPLGLLFVLKTRLHTHWATKVKKVVAFSMKLCRSRAMALPALYGYRAVGHFLSAEYICALLKRHVDRGAEFGRYKTVSSATFMPLTFTM